MADTHNENTRRIARNTLFLYYRMFFSMLVGLYSSRVILNALGVDDYGIFDVVGGFVAMFALVSSALSSSISRFLTYELGTGNVQRLKEVFSTSLLIQIVISVVIVILAETVGLWFVNHKMVIPSDRLYAANWVYHASVLSFILGLLSCPYNASIISHEKMGMFAYMGILNTLLKLGIVLFVAYSTLAFDRLIVYSLLIVAVSIGMQCAYMVYCLRNFKESRVWPKFYKECWKEMSGFAGWNAIGCTAGLLKDQGVNILLNLFFGPIVNAARGLSLTVSGAVNSFAGNFLMALSPQVTKSYASHDKEYCFSLVERGSRFGYYIIMILVIPLLLETPYVLSLWLGDYPAATVIFTRLVLVYALIEMLSNTLITLQCATGKIRNYQIAVGGLLLMNFPLSWLVLKAGAPSYSVFIVAICVGVGCLMLRLRFLQVLTGLSAKGYFKRVVANVVIVTMVAFVLPLAVYVVMPYDGFLRLVAVCAASLLCGGLSALYIGCTSGERAFIFDKINALRLRFAKTY